MGLAGDDVYIFAAGDGADIIDDQGSDGADRLIISGYTADEVTVGRAYAGGDDVRLAFAGSTDEIVISGGFDPASAGAIEEIEFDGRVIWTLDDLRAAALRSSVSDGNDIVYGFDSDDAIEAGLGEDVIFGGEGADTYIFDRGDGIDLIDDQGTSGVDRLTVHGYAPDDVQVERFYENGGGLKLVFPDTDDRISLSHAHLDGTSLGIEEIAFDDGTRSKDQGVGNRRRS